MSRRKQSKPQQHLGVIGEEVNKITGISATEEPTPSIEGKLDVEDTMHLDQKEDDSAVVPDSASDVHICTSCQGEFISTAQFLEHKEHCNQKQVVLIMNDHKETKEGPEETPEEDGEPIMDTHEDTMEKITPLSPLPEDRKDDKPEIPTIQQHPIDFSTQSMSQNENTRPIDGLSEIKDTSVTTSSGNSSTNPHVLSDITSRAANHAGKRNGIIKSFPLSSVEVIQEQLYTLHQQHVEQMKIILQIQEKIQALVAESSQSKITTDKETTKEATNEPTPLIKPRSLSAESGILGSKPPHLNVPSTLQILQNQVRQTPTLPFPAFPLSSSHSPFDLFPPSQPGIGPISNPLQVPSPYPGGLLSHRKGKSPNVSVFDPKFTDDAFFRHKCHFCHKVFGSDSALQIHIRSHTGERPFRCNICGNRFSTKGNLKVHFQRHLAQYPNVEMDITPYPPSPIPHDQPLQPPSIDQIPMPSIPSESTKSNPGDNPLSLSRQEDPSLIEKHGMGEINNNDKLSEIYKEKVAEKEEESRMETFGDEAESCRPSSAPSKVISSTLSPTDDLMPEAATGDMDSREEMSLEAPSVTSSVTSPAIDGEMMKSSETSKLQHLVESIEQKITEPNQCVICHKVLSCKNALQLHYRIHTGERPYKCKICGRTFTTKGNLKTHYSVHKTKPSYPLYHECHICQKNFANPVVLQQHLKLHAAEDMMHSTFNRESYFREECESDKKSENLMESLQARFNHMRETAINGDDDKHDLTRPLEEKEETTAKRQKLSDSEMESISSTRVETDEEMSYLPHHDNVVNGEKEHSNRLRNLGCTNLEAPTLMIDQTRSSSEGALDLTPKATSSSPDSVRSEPLAYTTSGQEHSRMLNSESFKPTFESGKSSPDTDIDLKPYTNSEMHQIFDSNIPSFLMGRHRNRSNTTCYFCGKTFACASALNIHYRSHTKERPFKCDVCCKGFSTRGNLKQHMLTHKIRDMPSQLLGMDMTATNNGANNVTDKTSEAISESNRQTHPSKEEEVPEPKRQPSCRHQCHVCDKQFQSDSALQIHVRTHTGEKPYKCHICGRAFTTKGNMKVHLGTHMWNGGSRRGRRITMDPPLMMAHKDNDIYRNEIFNPLRPGLDYPFFHYPPPHPLLNGFNHLGKPNEISVIQNPHSLGMHYPPPSESSLLKNGSTESLSNGYPRSNSSGGSGHSSPDKKSYSPSSAEVEHHLLPAFPPSSQSSTAMNYLNLIRLSRGAESSERTSPDMPSYMTSGRPGAGLLFPPSGKPSLPNSPSLTQESSLSNHIRSTQSVDTKSSIYTRERPPTGYLRSDTERVHIPSPVGNDDKSVPHRESMQVEESLTSASRMVPQLQSQRA